MNENLARKHEIVETVHNHFLSANLAVLAEYRGVDVAGMSALRRKARESDVHIQVVKNTLARRAAKNTEFECLTEHFTGPVAITVANDPVAAAKTVAEFAKQHDHFKIQTGAFKGQLISVEEVQQLAMMPSREELLAKLLATLAAPIQQFVATLNEVPSGFVRCLAAIRDSAEENSESQDH